MRYHQVSKTVDQVYSKLICGNLQQFKYAERLVIPYIDKLIARNWCGQLFLPGW